MSKRAQQKKEQEAKKRTAIDTAVRQIELSVEKLAADAEKVGLTKKGMTKAQTIHVLEKMQQEEAERLRLATLEADEQRKNHSAAIKTLLQNQEEEKRRLFLESKYVNVEKELPMTYTEWAQVAPTRWVRFAQFDRSNGQMEQIVELFNSELSEPYNSFTYQFFVFGWPDLCLLAYGVEADTAPPASEKGTFVGAVVSRVSRKGPNQPLRGYVAMLAVSPSFRGARIGSRLVEATVALMRSKGCDEVSLETPVSNQRALKLYTDLGFCKIKFLPVYYLDGSDAFRLKLYLNDFVKMASEKRAAANAAIAGADEDEEEGAVPPLEEQSH